jgi:hypothetical protein
MAIPANRRRTKERAPHKKLIKAKACVDPRPAFWRMRQPHCDGISAGEIVRWSFIGFRAKNICFVCLQLNAVVFLQIIVAVQRESRPNSQKVTRYDPSAGLVIWGMQAQPSRAVHALETNSEATKA